MTRAPAAMLLAGDDAGDHLSAKAAELERQFEGYKRRLADRGAAAVVVADHPDLDVDVDGDGAGVGEEEEEMVVLGRGRRYEAYVRRRDEKLRQGWRERMERKEAEMQALWARLDRGCCLDGDSGLTAGASPAREQKPRNVEKPILPATPKCSPAMKLPRLRSCISSSPSAAAAASPRPPNRRASHRQAPPPAEPPTTPRKENRVPPPTPRPLKTLSRTRSSLKDSKEVRGVRESPRPPPPRFQPPRASYVNGAGDPKEAAHAPSSSADAIAVARSCFREQVVLAEIKVAAAVASEPYHLRRSGNGVVRASPPLVTLRQVHGCLKDNIGCNNVETSEYSDVEAKNPSIDGGGNGDDDDDEIAQCSDKLGNAEITGDSDTEPSYVFIEKDNEEQEPSATIVKESPVIDAEGASRESSESLYSNVQSSFSHGSELDASATDSPLHSPPPSRALSTEQLLEADAAMLRKRREEEEEADESILIPGTARSRANPVAAQSPMDTVAGLKRFLNFGKKNSKGAEDSVSHGWPSGYSIRPRSGFSDAASDDLDDGYVISPHALLGAVRSLQSFVSSPARSELKETVPPAKSPRVHRSFFSFSSFKNRGN